MRFLKHLSIYLRKKLLSKKIALLSIFLIFTPFLYVIYSKRIAAFGCFDDCSVYMASYFMTKGKKLYEEIFFNHQMLMPVISFLIQKYLQPDSIYRLILVHRIFIFIFAVLFNSLLILRFGGAGLIFALFYEFTKYYLFGDRFLPEALIVYPFVYMVGLLYVYQKKKINNIELFFSAFLTWIIVFMREPYVPAVIILFIFLLLKAKSYRVVYISLAIFFLPSSITLFMVPLKEYFFNVVTVNKEVEIKAAGIDSLEIFKIFGYPVYIFFDGIWNNFRIVILILNVFFISFIVRSLISKKTGLVFIILLILGLTNIRYVLPGTIFYDSFHMLPWYGIFLITISFFISEIFLIRKRWTIFTTILMLLLFFYIIISPQSFINEKVDTFKEFNVGFGQYYSYGEVVRILADSKDSLFLDGFDDLVYWQAKIFSSYNYSWYTSVMPYFKKYRNARLDMFHRSPPDFYYGSCLRGMDESRLLPAFAKNNYVRFYFSGKPSCLFVYKVKLQSITQDQLFQIKKLGYYLL